MQRDTADRHTVELHAGDLIPTRYSPHEQADRDALIFDPVETVTGESMRLHALGILDTRIKTLQDRGRRQRLTPIETRELNDSQAAIHTLKRMAPVGPLLPPRAVALD